MIPLPRHHLRRVIDPLSPSRVPWGCQGVVWARTAATSIDTYRAKLVFIEKADLCIVWFVVSRRIIPLSSFVISFVIICTNDHFASINPQHEFRIGSIVGWIIFLSFFLSSSSSFFILYFWNSVFQIFITTTLRKERIDSLVKEKYWICY